MINLRSPVVAAGLITFALTLNLSAGNVVLPAVEGDLGTTTAVSRWVVLGYALAAALFVPVVGRLQERLDRRRALLLGVAGFGVASGLCALAPEIVTLLAGRVLLGAFAALLMVLAAVLAVSGPGPRAGGLAVAAVCATLGGFIGAAAGGGLVSPLGWRGLLLLPVPLCLLALTARVPDMLAPAPTTPNAPAPTAHVLSSTPSTPGAQALTPSTPSPSAPSPSALTPSTPSPSAITSPASGALAVTSPGLFERMEPPSRVPALLAVMMLATLDALVVVLCPFFLFQGQVQQAALPLVGLTVLGLPLGLMVAGAAGARLAGRFGPRAVALAGAVLAAAGVALLLPLSPTWSAAEVALRLALVGAGMGLYGGTSHSLIMAGGSPDRSARHLQLTRGLGYILGATLASTLWAATDFSRTGMGTALLPGLGVAVVALLTLIPFRSMTTRRPSLQRPGAPWTPTRSRV
ncbi:MFS transporter [Nonomuraea insulae]|uniref:MFS transporter n=1 Tax=Nonomuraea insulae TaxID=1616787 RepID=A0ABW1CVI8_9ACTN